MDEIAKRFAELAEKYGPNVVEAARQAASIEGYSTLVGSLLWLLSAACLILSGRYLWNITCKDEFDTSFVKLASGLILLAAFPCLLSGIWSIIDPWTWTAINHPDLWIAKRILKL
jgi:hypothetical protein